MNYTGYWTFFANPKFWNVEKFLRDENANTTYTITDYQRNEFKVGQLGVIRVGRDQRTKFELNGRSRLSSGIYAIVEVMSEPKFCVDPDTRYWIDENEYNKEKYRVNIRILKNFINSPILIEELDSLDFTVDKYLRNGFQASTMPLELNTFNFINKSYDIYFEEIDNIIEDSNIGACEGEIKQRVVNIRKRSNKIRELKKSSFIKEYGKLFCEVCGEDDKYTIEVHHEDTYISDMNKDHLTKLSDLRIVCANCHRKLHGYKISISELKNKIIK